MNKNFKDTLLIGKTDFDMKADLKTKEPNIQNEWKTKDIYKRRLKNNSKNKSFILHDGPPYANGDIHAGHALNKILKDIIVRWKMNIGLSSEFIMGWDTHGLPIETAIQKTGVNRKEIDPVEFRKLCEKYALEQVEKQKLQFERLGIFTDYEKVYITLKQEFENYELKLFAESVKKGLVYRGYKPVYWSPSSESALAEAEIEYQDVRSASIFVAMNVISGAYKDSNVVIWTTTPWTIPTNQLVAISKEVEYVSILNKETNQKYIVAKNLASNLIEKWEFKDTQISDIDSQKLINSDYQHAWFKDKVGKVVWGHHVTDASGTGLVHVAGGFGEDDFIIVKEHGIDPFVPIDNSGKFTKEIEDERLIGVFYDDSSKIVGIDLKENNKLLKLEFIKHSYPHDWRTKKPVMYRATHQWFVNIDKVKDEIDNAIVKNVTTKPDWSKERLRNIIKERADWTISRQRIWGVPIIAFFDNDGNPVLNYKLITHAISVIEKLGTNSWFVEPADTFLPNELKGKGYTKEKDILDVWFDSGSSNIVMREVFGLKAPFDVYLEGNDQYRGWFNSSMINSIIYDGKPAYKHLITHGMTNDEKGKKMSKSLGNGVDPIKICDTMGADILRLWVSSTNYTDDQKLGDNILKQVSESYRKLRNTMRFLLSNLSDFNEKTDYQSTLEDVDKYALANLTKSKHSIHEAYESYSFNNVFKQINNYVINDLSSFYLDFIKDILYIDGQNSKRRRQVQTVLFEQLWMLIDVLKPLIPHTIEEVYTNINVKNKEDSIHLVDMRKQEFKQNDKFMNNWNLFEEFRDNVNGALETARQSGLIKKGFEAIVNVELSDKFNFIKDTKDLHQILIVNKIVFTKQNVDELKISIDKKEGQKCVRCWAIFDNLTDDSICERCDEVVKGM
ncbi:isoleucine--tRNA ligase [Spiroplasma endosymbiont of Othius punctulatus]|uniref:isoleucine--tRNA ligase n=1 Tax=Spiroplasma endosymbiont of Othius punctulatus TaxID=3066289 RepID=UPI0030CAF99F